MKRRTSFIAIASVACACPSFAVGYGPWRFGMSREQVKAQLEYGPYYDFRNGDLGTKNGPFEDDRVPTSYYFLDDRLVRIITILYLGNEYNEARKAYLRAFVHIKSTFGGAELPTIGKGTIGLAAAEGLIDNSNAKTDPTVHLQIGANPMPKDKTVWCTFSRVATDTFMVALNYAKPDQSSVNWKEETPEYGSTRVYIVPMNDFPEQLAADVARVLTDELKIPVRSTLRLGDLNLRPIPGTSQLSADQILEESIATVRRFPDTSPTTYYLLLTGFDINSNGIRSRYVFSWHNTGLNASVLSAARLLEYRDGKPIIDSQFYGRLIKMSKRAVGEVHLGWKRSNNPQDVMYSPIMGLQDIDRIGVNHLEPSGSK